MHPKYLVSLVSTSSENRPAVRAESHVCGTRINLHSRRPMDCTTVFTDGAAKGNPGPGGWGAIVVTRDEMATELGGGPPHTTNNKMELSVAIAALERRAHVTAPLASST